MLEREALEDEDGPVDAALRAYALDPTEDALDAIGRAISECIPPGFVEVFSDPAGGASDHLTVGLRLTDEYHRYVASMTEKVRRFAIRHGLASDEAMSLEAGAPTSSKT